MSIAIPGLRNTTDLQNPTGRRPENWREMILRLYPYGTQQAPLAALTALMKSEATTDPIFHWFSKKTEAHRFKLAANLSGGDASGTSQSITIDTTESVAFGVKEGDVLMVEQTGELIYVASTPTVNNTIVGLRGYENAASQAVTYNGDGINPYLLKIGSAYEEGSSAPDPIGWDPTENSNYTQIFRETYALTGTAMNTKTRTGDEVKESKTDCFESFTTSMEKGFIFGRKRLTVRNGQPLRMTGGIIEQLPAARKISMSAYNGLISLKYWETLIADIFRYGSPKKLAFCGVTAILAITQMVRLNTQLQWTLGQPTKAYGMDVQELTTPMGTLVLKIHPMFGQLTGGTNGANNVWYPGFDNAMLILDMANLKYRYMAGRDVKYQPNLQLPGVDGMLAGYIGECGLEIHHPETHLFIKGLRGGAKDED